MNSSMIDSRLEHEAHCLKEGRGIVCAHTQAAGACMAAMATRTAEPVASVTGHSAKGFSGLWLCASQAVRALCFCLSPAVR